MSVNADSSYSPDEIPEKSSGGYDAYVIAIGMKAWADFIDCICQSFVVNTRNGRYVSWLQRGVDHTFSCMSNAGVTVATRVEYQEGGQRGRLVWKVLATNVVLC